MNEKDLMALVNRYTEACDDLGAGLFEQTEAETSDKHSKAKALWEQIGAEFRGLKQANDGHAAAMLRNGEALHRAEVVLRELLDLHGMHLQILLRVPGHEQMALEYAERHPLALARAADVLGPSAHGASPGATTRVYTEAQVREFSALVRAAERERYASLCDAKAEHCNAGDNYYGANAARDLADTIRTV
jgi:hypothetical protein